MGETDRSKGAKKLYQDTKNYSADLGNQDFQVDNLFQGYQSPYSGKDQMSKLDQIYGRGISDMNKGYAGQAQQAQQGAAQRLSSQGINKGSLYNNSVANAGQQAYATKPGAMAQLLNQQDSASINVMNNANQQDFRNVAANQNVQSQNVGNKMNKYQMLAAALGLQGGAVGMQDDTNWLDDSLAVANTASKFIPFL